MQPDPTPRQPQQRDAYAGECGDPIWECDSTGEMREDPAYDPHAASQRPIEPGPAVPGGTIIDLRTPGPQ